MPEWAALRCNDIVILEQVVLRRDLEVSGGGKDKESAVNDEEDGSRYISIHGSVCAVTLEV